MKDIEFRYISELMKNSCRSDRKLAKALGTSQPTVMRLRHRLLKEGYLKEFTIIPNFQKLGYHLLALTFFTWSKALDESRYEEARRSAIKKAPQFAANVILIERGIGLKHDSFMISLHKDYTSYMELVDEAKKSPYLNSNAVDSFIVNLDDKIHYRSLTFSTLFLCVIQNLRALQLFCELVQPSTIEEVPLLREGQPRLLTFLLRNQ